MTAQSFDRWVLSDRPLTVWSIWTTVASVLTMILGIVLVWRTVARGEWAVDATLAQQLSSPIVALLAALWIIPVAFAYVADRAIRGQRALQRPPNDV